MQRSLEKNMESLTYVTSLADLHEHIQRNEPCVYRVPQDSRLPCQIKWTKDYLAQAIGHKEITARKSSSRKYIDPSESFCSLVRAMLVYKITMKEFLNEGVARGMVISGTDTYLFHDGMPDPSWATVWADAKGLIDSNPPNDSFSFLTEDSLRTTGLWISGKGIKSILHYDDSGDNNLNFQIRGTKRIVMFPPTDWPKLKTLMALSLHDLDVYGQLIDEPEKTLSSESLEGTHPTTALLQENDVLYIPSRWYHYVKHEGDFNVNLTCWFKREALRGSSTPGNGIPIPRRSCSDHRVVIKLVSVFALSTLLNFLRRFTGMNSISERDSR